MCDCQIRSKYYAASHGDFCSVRCASSLLEQTVSERKRDGGNLAGIFRVYDRGHEHIAYVNSLDEGKLIRGAYYIAADAGLGPVAAVRASGNKWDF
jgi:hypothetical protein